MLGFTAVFAGSVGTATASLADAMSFQTVTLSTSGHCTRKRCLAPVSAEVITASGEINNSTAEDFRSFLSEHVGDGHLRPVILIHSPGGTVVGSMQLGLAFRRLGAAVIVARAGEDEEGTAHVVPGACMSACVYAFFGGTKRVIPSESRLGIHRMAVYGSERDPAGGTTSTRSYGGSEIVGALTDYTRAMGVDPAVIGYAETIDPSSIHIVTPREISRWRMGSPRL